MPVNENVIQVRKRQVLGVNVNVSKIVVGPVRTNCYLVNRVDSDKAVIIDPGDEADSIERALRFKKLMPAAILLTHGHFDHIGAVNILKKHFGIPVYAYYKEEQLLAGDMNLGRAFGMPVTEKADIYVKDNEKIVMDDITFQVLYTPGHTIGSCCFYVEKENILFSGDTLFCCSHGRTDFPTGSESAIIRSIVERLLVLDDKTHVYPGHEEETTIGSEKRFYDIY